MEMNEVLEKLPQHLLDLVIEQPYNEYTAQDHAVWRYVMRQNVKFLSEVAHHSYVDGLQKTGISIDSIPHMYGMNRILKEIGWAAVAVDGFIPPSAFMEFQAYNVLVIAADIRPIDQIEYTPAPDIIHEAAGHAPIIADPEYAAYLREFGRIGSRAFSSARDHEIYEAVRHLSILKADPYTTEREIEAAKQKLAALEGQQGPPSEMSQIRNLHWWTVEYGLVGDLKNPKIYGAGLLSSIGESYSALQDKVKKIPYTQDAASYNFDITTQQPQLFVTPNFNHLNDVLQQYADTMALRTGGVDGLLKAIDSNNTATVVYSSGLQVSGTLSEVIIQGGEPVYIRTGTPTSLCHDNKELSGHSKDTHRDGFGSPVGQLKGVNTPLEDLSSGELESNGISTGKSVRIGFASGVTVEGHLESVINRQGKNLLFSFTSCRVTYRDRTLFKPSQGRYDMAAGAAIPSVFAGPADPFAFRLSFPLPEEKTHKIVHSEPARKLHELYKEVRSFREAGGQYDRLEEIHRALETEFPAEWLLPLEILEIAHRREPGSSLAQKIQADLELKASEKPGLAKLITDGLDLIRVTDPSLLNSGGSLQQ